VTQVTIPNGVRYRSNRDKQEAAREFNANRRSGNRHDGITRILDRGAGLILAGTLAQTVVEQRFHGSCQLELSGCHRFFMQRVNNPKEIQNAVTVPYCTL
jgi:hypothetical protein